MAQFMGGIETSMLTRLYRVKKNEGTNTSPHRKRVDGSRVLDERKNPHEQMHHILGRSPRPHSCRRERAATSGLSPFKSIRDASGRLKLSSTQSEKRYARVPAASAASRLRKLAASLTISPASGA